MYKIFCDFCGNEMKNRAIFKTMYKGWDVRLRVSQDLRDADCCSDCQKNIMDCIVKNKAKGECDGV